MLRDLTEEDLPTLMELAELMHGESAYSAYPFYAGQTEYILRQLIQKPTCFTKGWERKGVIVGGFLGEVVPDLWCHMKTARDVIFYVRPEARGSMAGARLIKAFEKWSEEQGADIITPIVYAGVDNQKASKVLLKMGYSGTGSIYSKEVRACASV